jgi:PAS domain S-box-containing protein
MGQKIPRGEIVSIPHRAGAAKVDEVDVRYFANVLADASVGLSEISPSGRFVDANAELCRIVGRSPEETTHLTISQVTHPDDVDRSRKAVAAVMESGISETIDKRYVRPDGSVVWTKSSIARIGASRKDAHIMLATRDVTDTVKAETALSESERRFRQFAEASPNVIWVRNAETLEFEFINDAVSRVYGIESNDLGAGHDLDAWTAAILPQDRDAALASLHSVRGGEKAVAEYRIRLSDGTLRWIRSTTFPMVDDDGTIRSIGGICGDATEEKLAFQARNELLSELQHRARNIMSIVRSVVRRSSRTSADLPEFVNHLEGRLGVLSRTQNLLTRDVDALVDLETMVRDELTVQAAEEDRVVVAGPKVALASREAEVLALTIHELATNSVKFGALTLPDGRTSISWSVDASRVPRILRFEWNESGVQAQTSGIRRGFGWEMVERRLPYDLGGEGRMHVEPDGLRAMVTFPLTTADASAAEASEETGSSDRIHG